MTSLSKSWQLIDTPESLLEVCRKLENLEWVAVDTEFMRESTYFPELCLLQLASPDWAVCVDPKAGIALEDLLQALYRPTLTKVFHAAEQDLELFNQLTGRPPPNLFDTQIAAPLLGYPEQTGYARLVEAICGRTLDKSQTRTDWSHRPLSEAQLQYAADDVIELVKIYQHLKNELASTGRTDWLEADWQHLADSERFNRSPDRAWERLKGLDRLSKKARGAAQHLAIWREHQALKRNRPRNWIVKDSILLDIAKQLPRNMNALSRIRGMPESVLKRDGSAILRAAEEGQGRPLPLCKKSPPKPLTHLEDASIDAMSALVKLKAHEHQINPQVLAPRRSLEKLLRGDSSEAMRGWRGSLLSQDLDKFLTGELILEIKNHELSAAAK